MKSQRVRRFIENLWGPSGSIILHVLIVITLIRFVHDRPKRVEPKDSVPVTFEIESVAELDTFEELLDEWADIPSAVAAEAPPAVPNDAEPPQMAPPAPGPVPGDLPLDDIMEAVTPITIKELYANRSAPGRAEALEMYGDGVGVRTEYAVLKALNWLRDHQYPDGSWGPHYRVGMTGLALLTFLAHGETTGSPDYGTAIRDGLRYLLRKQKDGMFVGGGPHWNSHILDEQIRCYEHAIATYAISEAYSLTQIPFLKHPMEDAVQVILDGQHAAGSWDYDYRLDAEANTDVSLAGWHIQAMKAALAARASNRGLQTALESSMAGLKASMIDDQAGLFSYGTRLREAGADMSMTGVAVLCMQLGGHVMDAEARYGIKRLADLHFRLTKTDPEAPNLDKRQTGRWPLYAWYYITQARFHQGGRTWETWNREFAYRLCDTQNTDGSWCPPPDTAEARYGPVYCTSLSTLMLEVYYRVLPTYQQVDMTAWQPEEGPDDAIVVTLGEEA